MTSRAASLATLAVASILFAIEAPATAEPSATPSPTASATPAPVTADDESLLVEWSQGISGNSSAVEIGSEPTGTAAASTSANSCLEERTPGCQTTVTCSGALGVDGSAGYQTVVITEHSETMFGPCQPAQASAAEPARITPGRVLQAFRRIPLPAAKLDIQPPGGKTLVNLDTIFSTTTGDLDRTITLLGRRIQLRITPTSYTWHHGDGTTQTSDWPGRPWEEDLDMSAYLVHAYEDAHVTVRPSVDVTYSADYRIGNGPWQPVNGTVTIEGPPSALRIVEARPVLTGAGR